MVSKEKILIVIGIIFTMVIVSTLIESFDNLDNYWRWWGGPSSLLNPNAPSPSVQPSTPVIPPPAPNPPLGPVVPLPPAPTPPPPPVLPYSFTTSVTMGPSNASYGKVTNTMLVSNNLQWLAIMQPDSNFVVYPTPADKKTLANPKLATMTNPTGANSYAMQTAGNFVLYTPNNIPVFATSSSTPIFTTNGLPAVSPFTLSVSNNGNLQISDGNNNLVFDTTNFPVGITPMISVFEKNGIGSITKFY